MEPPVDTSPFVREPILLNYLEIYTKNCEMFEILHFL